MAIVSCKSAKNTREVSLFLSLSLSNQISSGDIGIIGNPEWSQKRNEVPAEDDVQLIGYAAVVIGCKPLLASCPDKRNCRSERTLEIPPISLSVLYDERRSY